MSRRMTWTLAAAVVVVLAVVLAAGAGRSPARAAGEEQEKTPRLISVSGTGSVKIAPDMAQVNLGVWAEAPTAKNAQSTSDKTATAVINAVKAEGVAERDIQTVSFSLYPVTRWNEDKNTDELIGYRAEHMVSAVVRDITRVGRVIDAAVGAGANRVDSISFQVSDPQQAKLEAMEKAVVDARKKADTLARAAGVQITGVQSISANDSDYYPQPFMRMSMGAGGNEAAASPVQPGEVEIRVTVSVAYEF